MMRLDHTYWNPYDGMVMLTVDDWKVETYPGLLETVADRYRGTDLDNLRRVTLDQVARQNARPENGPGPWYTGQADMADLCRLQLLFVLAEAMDWDWFDTTTA